MLHQCFSVLILLTVGVAGQALWDAPALPQGTVCFPRMALVWCFGGDNDNKIRYFNVNDATASSPPPVHLSEVELPFTPASASVSNPVDVSSCSQYVAVAEELTGGDVRVLFLPWSELTTAARSRTVPQWSALHVKNVSLAETGWAFTLAPGTCRIYIVTQHYLHEFVIGGDSWRAHSITSPDGVLGVIPGAPIAPFTDDLFIVSCLSGAATAMCRLQVSIANLADVYQANRALPMAIYRGSYVAFVGTDPAAVLIYNITFNLAPFNIASSLTIPSTPEMSSLVVDVNGAMWLLGGTGGKVVQLPQLQASPFFSYQWNHGANPTLALLTITTQPFAIVRLTTDMGCSANVHGTGFQDSKQGGEVTFTFDPNLVDVHQFFVCVSFGTCRPAVKVSPYSPPGVSQCSGALEVNCLSISLGCCLLITQGSCGPAYQSSEGANELDGFREWQVGWLVPWTRTRTRSRTHVLTATNANFTRSPSRTLSHRRTFTAVENSSTLTHNATETLSDGNVTSTKTSSRSRHRDSHTRTDGSFTASGNATRTYTVGSVTGSANATQTTTSTATRANWTQTHSLTLSPRPTRTRTRSKTNGPNSTSCTTSQTRTQTLSTSVTRSPTSPATMTRSDRTLTSTKSGEATLTHPLPRTHSLTLTVTKPRLPPPSPPSRTLEYAIIAAITVALVMVVGGCAVRSYCLPRWKKRQAAEESVRIALLSQRGNVTEDMPQEPPISATDALANFTILRRIMVNNNVKILLAKRRIQRPKVNNAPVSSNRGRHLQVVASPRSGPEYQLVVLKMTSCFQDFEKQRALQEFALLQQVALRTKNVTTPYDMFYQAPSARSATATESGPLRSLREVPPLVTLVMEYYPMGDLESYISRFKAALLPIPESSIVVIIHHLAATLAVMHSRCRPAVVHLDVKPSNVLLKALPDGRVDDSDDDDDPDKTAGAPRLRPTAEGFLEAPVSIHLGDFGSARRITSHAVVAGEAMTPAFGSPECFRSESRVTAAIDIWALGLTLYNLAMQKLPSEVIGYLAITDADGAAAAEFVDGMCKELADAGRSPQLVSLMRSMLSIRPTDRVAATVVRDLSRALITDDSRINMLAFPSTFRASEVNRSDERSVGGDNLSARSAEMDERK